QYDIQQGTLSAGANYVLTFISHKLTIGQAALTVTADAQSKMYGAADPALTYQITSGKLLGSDQLTGTLSRLPGEAVGQYDIQQGTLSAGANYVLTFIGHRLTIGQAALTVTADAQSKMYGAADPALTYQITSGKLVGQDQLTGTLTRPPGEAVGQYDIQQGT